MAHIHGVPGEWARVLGMAKGLWPLYFGIFASGFSIAICIFVHLAVGSVALVLSLAGMGWSLIRGLRRVEGYFKGARGEERVAGILKNLPDGYHVFNDFVVGRAHVDHVVVGPPGVFAIETKCWSGKVCVEEGRVLYNGVAPSHNPLEQVRRESELVRGALQQLGWKGDVTPVLAFASDNFIQHSVELNGAVVINSCELSAAFGTTRVVLPPDELSRIVTLMENNQR